MHVFLPALTYAVMKYETSTFPLGSKGANLEIIVLGSLKLRPSLARDFQEFFNRPD